MMKRMKKKRLYFVSGLALLMLLALPVWKLMTYVVADQGINAQANLQLTRTISSASGANITNGEIQRGETFSLNYKIKPPAVNYTTQPSQSIRISNISFTDKLPPNIELNTNTLPSGFTKTGTLSEGYTITAYLGDIKYNWSQNSPNLSPDLASNAKFNSMGEIVLAVPASATVTKKYTFAQGTLSYTDLHEYSSYNSTQSNSGSTLGIVGDYGLFVLNNGTTTGNFTLNGSLAVGGDLSLTNTSGGGTINGNVIVNKNFNYYGNNQNPGNGGNIGIKGNVIYGQSFNYGGTSLSQISGNISQQNPMKAIDFKTASGYWLEKSKGLNALTANGTSSIKYGNQLFLEVTDTTLPYYVFKVTADQITTAAGIILNTPVNSTVIINIEGTSINMNKWTTLNNKPAQKLLFNFVEAKNLLISSGQIGTFLAPLASVNATNGSLTGSLIVSSWDFGNGSGLSFNPAVFTGIIPDTPALVPIVSITKPFTTIELNATDPVDNTPRTLTLQGESIVKLGSKVDLKAIYTGPATEKDITYTWIVTQDGKDVTASKLKNGVDNTQKVLDTSQAGDYKVIVKVNSSNLKVETTAEKIISVRSLTIDGPDNIFVTKTKDYTLTTGNIPANSLIKWSITKSDEQYATLSKVSGDTTNTKYTLTGNQIHNGVVITVEAGGITETRTVNIIPFSLTGLSAIGEIEINVGQELDLNRLLHATPSEMDIDDIKNQFSWTSNMPHIANFDSNPTNERKGIIRGIQKGENVLVTVSYTPPGTTIPITATIRVKVNTPPNGDLY